MGFPDINSLEPLAEALGVSVLELMKSEKIVETNIQCGDVNIRGMINNFKEWHEDSVGYVIATKYV